MAWTLVTGGAGFIGSHLVDALLARGEQVRILDNFDTGCRRRGEEFRHQAEVVEGSVADPAVLARVLVGVETVYHLAAVASVQRSIETPALVHEASATGTLHVLEASRRAKVRRVVYAGSSSCYGDQGPGGRTEDDPLRPQSPYAAAKLAGEFYCAAFAASFGLETVRVRFFNVYGPRQDPHSPYSGVIALFIRALKEGRRPKVHGDGLQSRDFIFVADAVKALLRAGSAPSTVAGRVFNIGTGQATTILELLQALSDLSGVQVEPEHGPARPGDVRHSLADITRARRELNFEPTVSLREGLKQTWAD